MWEKTRVDGSRKLKNNAIPTIFNFAYPKQNSLAQRNTSSPQGRLHEPESSAEHKSSSTIGNLEDEGESSQLSETLQQPTV